MTRRSYGQFCPVAAALDVAGDRWTLLLVRELLLGPRRFSDLLAALPGVGTSLLAERLKQLEAAGVVRRDRLPPPAGSAVYALTDTGRGLGPVVRALAEWGARLLGTPDPAETFRPEWLALYLATAVPPERVDGVRDVYELHVDGEVLHLRVAGGRVRVVQGPAPDEPDVVIRTDRAAFVDLGLGRSGLAALVTAGRARVDGDRPGRARAERVLSGNLQHA